MRITGRPPLRVIRALYCVKTDGSHLSVISSQEVLDPVPGFQTFRMADAGWPELRAKLSEEIAKLPPDSLRLINSYEALAADHDAATERTRLHQFARGHFVPVTGEEAARAARLIALVNSGQLQLPDPQVLARKEGRRIAVGLIVGVIFSVTVMLVYRGCGGYHAR